MAKLNNATNVLFSALILNGKASIDDVPEKLKDGVQAELDFFNDIGIVDDSEKETSTDKPATPTVAALATEGNSTDKALADVNDAVKDAEK